MGAIWASKILSVKHFFLEFTCVKKQNVHKCRQMYLIDIPYLALHVIPPIVILSSWGMAIAGYLDSGDPLIAKINIWYEYVCIIHPIHTWHIHMRDYQWF